MNLILKWLLLFLVSVAPVIVKAQMFSVSEKKERINKPVTIIRVGTSITDFKYKGKEYGTNQRLLELDNAIFEVMIETFGLTANAKIGNSITGLDNGSFLDLNLRFKNDFNIIKTKTLQAGIPIQLSSGLTTSNSDFTRNRFNQTHFAGGTGLFFNINPSKKLEIHNHGVYGYGFSSSNGGFFGGTLNYLDVGTKINVLNVIGERTLSIAYAYILRSYDIDEEIYDFDQAHRGYKKVDSQKSRISNLYFFEIIYDILMKRDLAYGYGYESIKSFIDFYLIKKNFPINNELPFFQNVINSEKMLNFIDEN